MATQPSEPIGVNRMTLLSRFPKLDSAREVWFHVRNAIAPDEIAVAVGQRAQVSEILSDLDWLTAHIPASLPLAWHFLGAVYTPVMWTPRRAE